MRRIFLSLAAFVLMIATADVASAQWYGVRVGYGGYYSTPVYSSYYVAPSYSYTTPVYYSTSGYYSTPSYYYSSPVYYSSPYYYSTPTYGYYSSYPRYRWGWRWGW